MVNYNSFYKFKIQIMSMVLYVLYVYVKTLDNDFDKNICNIKIHFLICNCI